MRSIYRIKRLASRGILSVPSSPVVRPFSTTAMRSATATATASSAKPLDLSEVRRLESEASTSASPLKWSDSGQPSDSSQDASSSTSGFFTTSRPYKPPIIPASPSDTKALHTLYPLLYRSPSERDSNLCTEIWRTYHHLSPSTRRSLHPTVLRMILRAVVPPIATRSDFKRKAKDPVRAFAAQSAKFERRLQVVIADMVRSTWVDVNGSKNMMTGPRYPDYYYTMSVLAGLGGTEACEAIFQEIKSMNQTEVDRSACLGYRLQALKVWMTERVDHSNFTLSRPGVSRPSQSQQQESQQQQQQKLPMANSLRWRADREDRDPSNFAITVLRDVLSDVSKLSSGPTDHRLYTELVTTLRQILRFLPEKEASVHETLRRILQQALEKGFGIDFRFLRQDPSFAGVPVHSSVLDSIIYLMGSSGEVWRMLAMFESLTGEAPAGSSTSVNSSVGATEEEDAGETLSSALAAEAASRSMMDWLGRVRDSEGASGASGSSRPGVVERDLPPHLSSREATAAAELSLNEKRTFDDFLPNISSLLLPNNSAADQSLPLDSTTSTGLVKDAESRLFETRLSPVRTRTITTMLNLIRKHGDIDLAVHVLRTSLHEAVYSRQAWLARVLAHNPEAEQTVASTSWMTRRTLLVSAQWFESVHHLARTQPGAIWAADLVRSMIESESRAIRDEYRLLTNLDISESIDEIPTSAPIHGLVTPPNSNPDVKVFNPTRHLSQLKQTHGELVGLLAVSVHQVERKRQLRALSNARRRERATIVAQAEAERLEQKKAGRRQKQEVQEATLVMA